jgi:hypothetical protein
MIIHPGFLILLKSSLFLWWIGAVATAAILSAIAFVPAGSAAIHFTLPSAAAILQTCALACALAIALAFSRTGAIIQVAYSVVI